jgi:hypothetical protein
VSISRDTPLATNLLAFLLRSHFERLVRRGLDGGLNEVDEGHELARLMRRAASMMPAAGRHARRRQEPSRFEDLNNPHDPEASAIAAGYRTYLKVMASPKELRDHSKLNQHTPIISAGLAAVGPPSPQASGWNTGLAVSLSDTIEFMRQNGMDNLVDGYGLHLHPDGDPHISAAARIATGKIRPWRSRNDNTC